MAASMAAIQVKAVKEWDHHMELDNCVGGVDVVASTQAIALYADGSVAYLDWTDDGLARVARNKAKRQELLVSLRAQLREFERVDREDFTEALEAVGALLT